MQLTREELNILDHIQICLALQDTFVFPERNTRITRLTVEDAIRHQYCAPQSRTKARQTRAAISPPFLYPRLRVLTGNKRTARLN